MPNEGERNEDVVRRAMEAMARGDGAAIDALCAPGMKLVDNPLLSEPGEPLVWASFATRMASLAKLGVAWKVRPVDLGRVNDRRFLVTCAIDRSVSDGDGIAVLGGIVFDLVDGRIVEAHGFADYLMARRFAGEPVATSPFE